MKTAPSVLTGHKWADCNHGLDLAHKQKMIVTALRRPKDNMGWKWPNGIMGR